MMTDEVKSAAKQPTQHVVREEFVEGTFRLLDGREVTAHAKPRTLQITTHIPDKWMFVDLESGMLWDSRYNIASSAHVAILRQIVAAKDKFNASRSNIKLSSIYKEKAAAVEAMQFTGDNFHDIYCFCDDTKLLDGKMYLLGEVCDTKVNAGDWLVKTADDQFFVINNEEFSKKYEKQ